MAQKVKRKSPQKGSLPKEENGETTLWKRRGMEDVYFQREAQVNLWTVLGGVAAAALLTQLSSLLVEVQSGRWFLLLYFVSSILIIVNSWTQTSWGSLVLKWSINIPSTLLMFIGQFSLSIQCLLITIPYGWMAAAGLLVLCALLQQVYFAYGGSWKMFSKESVKRIKINLVIYGGWVLMCFVAAVHLYFLPSALAETLWGVVALTASIAALVMQHIAMQQEKKELNIP